MITWITGNSGSGKTNLAKQLIYGNKDAVLLDGDELRKKKSLGFSKQDRWKHNIEVAELAKKHEKAGLEVIVAVICPYKALRKKVKKITNCKFIYLEGGKTGNDYPYEHPKLY